MTVGSRTLWRRIGIIVLYIVIIAALAFAATIIVELAVAGTIIWDWKLIVIPAASTALVPLVKELIPRLWKRILLLISGKAPEVARKIYSTIWKESSALTPEEVLGSERGAASGGFKEYYFERTEDDLFREELAKVFSAEEGSATKRHLLIKGRPLSGKSRLVYQWLTKEQSVDVLIPHYKNIESEIIIPKYPKSRRRKVLFLDDLQQYVDFQGFNDLLRQFLSRGDITIIALCRSGVEYNKVKNKLQESNLDLDNIFATIDIKLIEEQTAREIAANEKVAIPWEKVEFDGTIGSVFLQLSETRRRYEQICTPEQRTILQAMKLAYLAGIFRGRQLFPINWIKTICLQKFELEMKNYEWTELIRGAGIETEEEGAIKKASLERLEFLRVARDKDFLSIEEVYLEEIIEPEKKLLSLAEFEELQTIFASEPEAMFLLANRLADIGEVLLEHERAYKRATIAGYKAVLKVWKKKTFPEKYARSQNNLGVAYWTLAKVEERKENSQKAIDAFRKALQIRTFERFPRDYAQILNNLGVAYGTLADVENKAENCKEAIKAHYTALQVYTLETFPMDYALTQNNLGGDYCKLAEVENRRENCMKAIAAFEEALQVYTFKHFPIEYAMSQHNLGVAYRTLAEAEEKKENCQKAIEAYQKALYVRTFEHFPMHYAQTQNNLGLAYQTLAEVEETKENCKKAIEAFEEALRVRTFEHFPMDYAATQNNLGLAYQTLAEVEEKAKNCQQAIVAHKEALKIYSLKHFPMDYAGTSYNLGNDYLLLAGVEEQATNCRKAIEAFQEALKGFTKERIVTWQESVQEALERAKAFCAEALQEEAEEAAGRQ